MFNIGMGEWLLLAVLGIILVGPDRLPHVAAQAAQLVRRFKEISTKATEELRENLGPGFEDINVTDLHPKKFIARTLNEAALPTAEIREIVQQAKIDPDLL